MRTTPSHVDSVLPSNTQYYYRVQAANYAGSSEYSAEATATTLTTNTAIPLDALELRLKADCGYAANPINYWADQTTNGNGAYHLLSDFSIANSNQQPTWATDAMNGARAIRFQTNAFRLFPFTTNWTAAEVFVVLRAEAGLTNPAPGLWHICSGAIPSAYPWTNSNVWESFGRSTYVETPPTASLISPHLYNVASLLNSWSNRWNNGGGGVELTNTVAFDIDLRLGWSSQDAYFHGYISEIMLFNRGLTTDERNAVAAAYLRRRFGLW